MQHYLIRAIGHVANSSGRPEASILLPAPRERGEKCHLEGPLLLTNLPPQTLRSSSPPSAFPLPLLCPRANCFVTQHHNVWQFQLLVFNICKEQGNPALTTALLPSPAGWGWVGRKVQTHTLIIRSNDFMGTPHFVVLWLPSHGWGAAHLQTPAGLNGDSCMQRACLQPAWCTERLLQGKTSKTNPLQPFQQPGATASTWWPLACNRGAEENSQMRVSFVSCLVSMGARSLG